LIEFSSLLTSSRGASLARGAHLAIRALEWDCVEEALETGLEGAGDDDADVPGVTADARDVLWLAVVLRFITGTNSCGEPLIGPFSGKTSGEVSVESGGVLDLP
jgi:hypothetical protein